MAEIDLIKISELPATSTIGDADELAVVQGGATKKVPYSVLKAGAEVTPDTTLSEAGVPADAAAVGAALALKANQAAVTQALAAKADKTEVTEISGDIAELASVVETKADQTALNQKADKTTTDALRQDLTTLNGIVNQKADKTELNTQIGNVTAELATKANTADVNNLLAAKANVASPVFTGRPQAPTAPKGTATLQLATTAFVQNAIDDKQDTLTFDSTPTEGSTNPVTSGGAWEAVQTDKTLAVGDKAADAKITGEAITKLKNETTELKGAISPYVDAWYPAKYNIPKAEFPNNGYIATATGAVVGPSDTNWLNTNFIKVDEGAVIEGKLYLGLTGVVNSVSCYGSDFSYRSSDSLSAKLEGSFTVPSGVVYVRFCCSSSYTGQYVIIGSGAYKQGYIPYANNGIYGAKKNTNLIMIGDSYGIQNSDSDITKFYWEYVRDGLKLTEGVDFFKKFVIGTGFGSGGFLSNLQSLESSISNKEAITDIFVCGGWNDSDTSQSYGTDEAFAAGILAFDNYVKNTYPNARISLAHIGWGRLGEGMRTQLHRSFRRYVKASNTYGWRYITNSEYILHDYTTSNWQTDGAHPNNNGQKLLGESIVSAFLTGTADVYYASEASQLTQYGYASAISGNVYSEVNNNMCRVWSDSTNGLIEITGFTNNGLTPSGATEYAIAKITTPYFRGYQHYSCVETGCILLANSKKYHGTAKLRFDGDALYARFYVPHDNVDTWLSNLTNVYLVDFDLQVATIRA